MQLKTTGLEEQCRKAEADAAGEPGRSRAQAHRQLGRGVLPSPGSGPRPGLLLCPRRLRTGRAPGVGGQAGLLPPRCSAPCLVLTKLRPVSYFPWPPRVPGSLTRCHALFPLTEATLLPTRLHLLSRGVLGGPFRDRQFLRELPGSRPFGLNLPPV